METNEELLEDVEHYKFMLSIFEHAYRHNFGWPTQDIMITERMIWMQIEDKLLRVELKKNEKKRYKR